MDWPLWASSRLGRCDVASELNLHEGERLPWLETAADHDERQRRNWGVVLAVLGGLAVLLLVIGGVWFTRQGGGARGNGELIAAPAGPYKERADGSDGVSVGTDSEAMLAASDGQEARGRIGPAEQPTTVTRPPLADGTTTVAGSPTVAPTTASSVLATRSTVQLGALDDRATAEAQWTRLAGGRSALKGLNHSVEQVQSGGKTVFRLRAAVADPVAGKALCRQLTAANVPCFVVR